MSLTRASWDETWMGVAILLSRRSPCVRAQVGAVIVTADNRVDSSGYNGPIAGLELRGECVNWCIRARNGDTSADYSACATIHSEANALVRANHERIQGGTIYVSRAMCVNCAKLVGNSGLARVVHQVLPEDEHRHPHMVEDLIRQAGLRVDRF